MSHISNRSGRIFKKNQSAYLHGQLEYGLWLKNKGAKTEGGISKKALRTFWKNLSNLTIVFCGNESIEILKIQKKVSANLLFIYLFILFLLYMLSTLQDRGNIENFVWYLTKTMVSMRRRDSGNQCSRTFVRR